ncbi:MAG: methyltransferase domain-containing protein [Terriglobales bacterium]
MNALNERPAYALGYSQQEMERLIIQALIFTPFTRQLFQEAGITSGMRVLDVGCGLGDVTFLAAELVGPNGAVNWNGSLRLWSSPNLFRDF